MHGKLGPSGDHADARWTRKRIAVGALVTATILVNAHCFVDRSGTAAWRVEYDVRPTYLCTGETVTVSWDAGAIADGSFNVTLTRLPGGLLEAPDPSEPVDSTTFTPRAPTDPAGVAETTVTGLFSHVPAAGGGTRLASGTDSALVLGADAAFPHLERFSWGCDNAAGGGVGYSRVNYTPGDTASDSVRIDRIRNLSSVSVRVGMTRAGLSRDRIDTEVLAPASSSAVFAGPVAGVLTAVPEDLDSFGPDGCDGGAAPSEVAAGPGGTPVVIVPRPDIVLELTLSCVGP